MCTHIQVHVFACVYVNVCGRIMDTHKDQSSYDDMAYVINYNIDADEDDQPAKRALAKGFLTGMELPLWRTSEAIRSERSCQKWRNLLQDPNCIDLSGIGSTWEPQESPVPLQVSSSVRVL